MNRRTFIKSLTLGSGAVISRSMLFSSKAEAHILQHKNELSGSELRADIIIAGGGMGGCAAALAALRNGLSVIMTEETNWIGGQLTQQGVSCPDEHQWIENYGATQSYRDLRTAIRTYYKRYYPLTEKAKVQKYLDPGNGTVSRICHEPRVALAVLQEMLAPYLSSRKLTLLLKHKAIGAETNNDKIRSLKVKNLCDGSEVFLSAPYFLDATELGDLLPMTGTEFIKGAESKRQTHELHAAEKADPANQQAFTHCFAMDYMEGANNVIDKPEEYDFWKSYVPQLTPPWPGKLLDLKYSNPRDLKPKLLGFNPTGASTDHTLNLWNYRRIIDPDNFIPGFYSGGITIVNWPQNDFLLGNLVGVSEKEFKKTIKQAEQLGLSLFYWLQTEVPRSDGGQGWPGLRLRGDILGTENGLAKFPYVRESRRIKAVFRVLEEHVGAKNRAMVAGEKEGKHAAYFYDSVGVGSYHIDLHPTSTGNNYIDFNSLPFQIPLGALLPVRMQNLLPACKNIGTTHITNGCYRLHPVEWNIGESAGLLVAYALKKNLKPHAVRENKNDLATFQNFIRSQGVETHWPDSVLK
jgi:hypothetical protein